MIDVPSVNCQFHGNFKRQFKNADISIAVATPNGLMTPILRDANRKSINSISGEVKQLAILSKERRIKPEDYEGGTFTISNLGMYGIKSFNAIINPPQCAILAIGEIDKGHQMIATLSCDHRVIDGAMGAEWLGRFKFYLESPAQMSSL